MLEKFVSIQDIVGFAILVGTIIKLYQFKKFKGT